VVSPPLVAPAPPGAARPAAPVVPEVESYDEETYLCRPNDTFRTISLQFYNADKYERALLLFNRNHPRAAEGVRLEPPVLAVGQPVYIPPMRILEKQYAASIPNLAPLPAAPAPPASPGAAPGPRPAASAPAPTLPPLTTWSNPGGEPRYRVGRDGEKFRDIARQTLNNPDRWWDIWRLNPAYNPNSAVPAGTLLRLPADARIPTENRP
jgi:hypothetical protein